MIDLSSISLAEAIARGHDVWELAIPRWGFDTPSESNILYPPAPPIIPSVQGISIAPGSTVDRVNVALALRGTPPPTVNITLDPALNLSLNANFTNFFTVSARAPWVGFLPGPISLHAQGIFAPVGPEANIRPTQTGLVDTRYGVTYEPSGAAGPATFGPALGPLWQDPVLRVLFHLSRPSAPIGARAPMDQSFSNEIGMAAGETIARVFPIGGRRLIRVTVRVFTGNPSIAVRVTGLTPRVNQSPFDFDVHLIEHQLAPAVGTTTIAADNEATFAIQEPQMDFLLLKWAAPAGDSGAAVHFQAVD